MKLNKIKDILESYNGDKILCSSVLNGVYLDFQVKFQDKVFYRLYKDNSVAKIYGRVLYDAGYYIYKEIGCIDTNFMDNNDNYIVYPADQIAYSAAVVVDNMSAHDAVEKISNVTTNDDDFEIGRLFKAKNDTEQKDKEWFDTFVSKFYFTEASLVSDDNKILGKYRIDKINVPFIKNTKTENIMYIKVELSEILLVESTLKRFRKITNRIVTSTMMDIFGEKTFKVFPTNDPYKTQEVIKENAKYMHNKK